MGNGYPVAAVLLRSDIAAAMAERTTYFSTFGGNPVACAAALAVLDVIEEQQLVENARVVGEYLRGLLEELAWGVGTRSATCAVVACSSA